MDVARDTNAMGIELNGFDVRTATAEELTKLKDLVYTRKIVLLKGQRLTPAEFVDFGRRLGEIQTYYQPMYHHPEYPEIFVSSNVVDDGQAVGVPKTGKFWHADYSFMPRPFGLTIISPQVAPKQNRGTYFIDMGRAYEALPDELRLLLRDAYTRHSVRRYFKIRPTDVYRPICEILDEIEEVTPAIRHPAVITHPVTGESILYLSEAVTYEVVDADDKPFGSDLLTRLLELTGQLDLTFQHPNIHLQTFDAGDVVIWDNRSLVHRALHTTTPEPAVSHRITVHDDHPFYEGIAAAAR